MSRDRGALAEKPKREIRGAGGDMIPNRRAHEARYARRRGDKHPLFPHFLPDVVGEPRIEAGVEKGRGDGLDPWRPGAVELAEAQRMPIIEMDDPAVGVEGRRNGALPAEHAFGTEAFDQPVDMSHAVQERQNRGRWPDRPGEGGYRALEVECLAAQHHEVERLGQVLLQHYRRRSAMEVAAGAPNGQSMLRQLRRATRANEKRHVAACLQQTSAEITPDCARSNNKNSHVTQTLSE